MKAEAAARTKGGQAKLTAEQRKRVREMVEDEGATRAEAIVWVLAFEPAVSS